MAELIDKGELEKRMTEEWVLENLAVQQSKSSIRKDIENVIDNIPITTEAEIRAKAIDDFHKALEELTKKNWIDHLEYGITWAEIDFVTEQLKEE